MTSRPVNANTHMPSCRMSFTQARHPEVTLHFRVILFSRFQHHRQSTLSLHIIQTGPHDQCFLFLRLNQLFLAYFDPESFFFKIMKMTNCRGDLTNISVEKKTTANHSLLQPVGLEVWINAVFNKSNKRPGSCSALHTVLSRSSMFAPNER